MSANESTGQEARWHRGRYQRGFELSAFTPARSNERWWVAFGPSATGPLDRVLDESRGAPLEVEFYGAATGPGSYGHMGQYARSIVVERVRFPETGAKGWWRSVRERLPWS
jgi:hypothetical protein